MWAVLPALVLAAALWGCGSGEAAEPGSAASASAPEAEYAASASVTPENAPEPSESEPESDMSEAVSEVTPEDEEESEASEAAPEDETADEPVSSQLTPENLTEQYAPLLAGLWVASGSGDSYYINADGSGSLYPAEGETAEDFTWSVLAEQNGAALLYLFFTGAEAAERYLPVFDEDSLTLCDPDSGDAVLLLTVGETFG